ncbi:hypothetical protein, partial [uncultured Acinetobacter sp.]
LETPQALQEKLLAQIQQIETVLANEPNLSLKQRIEVSMNNIRSSIFHAQQNKPAALMSKGESNG